jgi:hypothetical protein
MVRGDELEPRRLARGWRVLLWIMVVVLAILPLPWWW